MDGILKVNYLYTEIEYCKAMRDFQYYSKRVKRHTVIHVVGIAFILFFWKYLFESWIGPTALILLGISLLLMFLLLFVIPRIQFRQNKKFRDEYFLTFTDEGIIFKTERIDSKIEWAFYKQVLESKEFFYLIYGRDMFSIIPKRAFHTQEDEETFRKLLIIKISDKIVQI